VYIVSAEKYKKDVMADEFRQFMLRMSSSEAYNFNETKKPTHNAVNESFRKLAVD